MPTPRTLSNPTPERNWWLDQLLDVGRGVRDVGAGVLSTFNPLRENPDSPIGYDLMTPARYAAEGIVGGVQGLDAALKADDSRGILTGMAGLAGVPAEQMWQEYDKGNYGRMVGQGLGAGALLYAGAKAGRAGGPNSWPTAFEGEVPAAARNVTPGRKMFSAAPKQLKGRPNIPPAPQPEFDVVPLPNAEATPIGQRPNWGISTEPPDPFWDVSSESNARQIGNFAPPVDESLRTFRVHRPDRIQKIVGDVVPDDFSGPLSSIDQISSRPWDSKIGRLPVQTLQPEERPQVQMSSAAAPQTSRRVQDARDFVKAQGVGTGTAKLAVPERGTLAADFRAALHNRIGKAIEADIQSKLGDALQAPPPAGPLPTLESITGPFTDRGRLGLGGIAPKRILESASGKAYLHKGGSESGYPDTPEGIRKSLKGNEDQVAQEIAATRAANLFNKKTPVLTEVAEGGTIQPLIDNSFNLRTLADIRNKRYKDMTPGLVRQLQQESVIDTLFKNTDNHGNQFVVGGPNNDILYAIDKGFVDLTSPNLPGSASSMWHFRAPARDIERGGKLNSMYDPDAAQRFIHESILPATSEQLLDAFNPAFQQRGLSMGDRNTAVRNFQQKMQGLGPLYEDYYRRRIMP